MMKLIILFFFVMIYIHIYLHFKINPLNELTVLNDICKQEISNTCYYKLPFVFDGKLVLNNVDLSNNINSYEPMPLLEPYVKYFTSTNMHKLKENKIIKLHPYYNYKKEIGIKCLLYFFNLLIYFYLNLKTE